MSERLSSSFASGVGKGLAAGAIGTLALSFFEHIEQAVVGRSPVYLPAPIATRLFNLAPGPSRKRGQFMRWAYGPTWGVVYVVLRRRLPRPSWALGFGLGGAIYLFELVMMPALGATPALSGWRKKEIVLLALHTSVFGVVTELALRVIDRQAN